MKIPFKVICIHDEDRPNDIPTSRWVVKGEEYTVIKVERMNMQGNAIGYELEEIDLSPCFPYVDLVLGGLEFLCHSLPRSIRKKKEHALRKWKRFKRKNFNW